jgi:hypothetical protein
MRIWAAQKFGLLLGAFLILTGLAFWDGGLTDIYRAYGGARVCFYLTAKEKLPLSAFSDGVFVIRNGGGVIVDAPAEAALKIRRGFSGIMGESVSFEGDYGDGLEILRLYRAAAVFEETLHLDGENSVRIIYGFSGLLTRSVSLDGKRVNIQIAANELTGKVTAGTPLILGSY